MYLEAVLLGQNLRRVLERRSERLRNVILREESRLSQNICDHLNQEGDIFNNFFHFVEYQKANPDSYILLLMGAAKREDISYPITIILDVDRDQNFLLDYVDAKGLIIAEHSTNLKQHRLFERYFLGYWQDCSVHQDAIAVSSLYLKESFDESRKKSHTIKQNIISMGNEEGISLIKPSDNLRKALYSFIATLWPHRENPFPQMLVDAGTDKTLDPYMC